MCGIAGIWNLDKKPVEHSTIGRFTDALKHRGPDGSGFWFDDELGIALGHRRLSILDLSENARQPMQYLDGRYQITFNGEIYNFIELRRELEAKGYVFHTQSDTEIVTAAYHEWGNGMLSRFNGMWAFAIFDTKERSLFLARDRYGIKPFLYKFSDNQFAFASELNAFKKLDGFIAELDSETASVYLHNAMAIEGSQRTMIKGVRRLQGGHCALLKDGNLKISRWWNTLDNLVEVPADFGQQAERFRELFYDSVKLRMRSDVSIGTCLSGGFDSTSIICTMSDIAKNDKNLERMPEDWRQAFVATFPGAMNDESANAKETVDYAGVKGIFFEVTENSAIEDIEQILNDFDDCYPGMPTAAWLIYKELRRSGVFVSLDGHGADELLGMYAQGDFISFYDSPHLLTNWSENKRRINEYNTFLNSLENPQLFKSPAEAIFAYHPDFAFAGKIKNTFLNSGAKLKRKLSGNRFSIFRNNPVLSDDDFSQVGANDELPKEWGFINRLLYKQFHSDVLPTILRNFDRVSMAHGVEVRMPFMDWRLVSYAFSLPDSSKLSMGMTKRIAREAMKNRIPESIRTSRLKVGFNSPLPEWLNGPLKNWVKEIIYSPELQSHDLINIKAFQKFAEIHFRNNNWSWGNSEFAWQIVQFLWFEKQLSRKSI